MKDRGEKKVNIFTPLSLKCMVAKGGRGSWQNEIYYIISLLTHFKIKNLNNIKFTNIIKKLFRVHFSIGYTYSCMHPSQVFFFFFLAHTQDRAIIAWAEDRRKTDNFGKIAVLPCTMLTALEKKLNILLVKIYKNTVHQSPTVISTIATCIFVVWDSFLPSFMSQWEIEGMVWLVEMSFVIGKGGVFLPMPGKTKALYKLFCPGIFWITLPVASRWRVTGDDCRFP